jgi:hypothetical protein
MTSRFNTQPFFSQEMRATLACLALLAGTALALRQEPVTLRSPSPEAARLYARVSPIDPALMPVRVAVNEDHSIRVGSMSPFQ